MAGKRTHVQATAKRTHVQTKPTAGTMPAILVDCSMCVSTLRL